jgi:hypothetical protein
MKSWLFLDGMARTTTDETTPALVATGVFAMNLIAGRIHIGGSPCPMWLCLNRSPGPHGTCLRVDSVVVKSASAIVKMPRDAYPRRCCRIRRGSQQ